MPFLVLAAACCTAAVAWALRAVHGIERAVVDAYNAGGTE
jgi:hypothetical protein